MNLDETKEYLLQIRDIDKKIASLKRSIEPVSYTHLTLPTILRV